MSVELPSLPGQVGPAAPAAGRRRRRRILLSLLAALVMSAAGAFRWLSLSESPENRARRADERDIRALITELERDLNRRWQFEFFNHITHEHSENHEHSEDSDQKPGEHSLVDTLVELSKVETLRFSDVEVAGSPSEALVQLSATGVLRSPQGREEPFAQSILVWLVKESGHWKIARVFPQFSLHSDELQKIRIRRK